MFRTPRVSATSAASTPLIQPLGSDVEAVIQLHPGSLPMDIGPSSSVDEYNGFRLESGTTLHLTLRSDDELWCRGSDPSTSSIAQLIIRSIGQPS